MAEEDRMLRTIALAKSQARAQSIKESKADSQKMGKTNGRTNYNAWITLIENSSNLYGYLREVKDSAIVFSNHLSKLEPIYETQNLDVKNIETLKFRKKGSVGMAMVIGALTGLGIGALLGYAGGDDKKSSSSGLDFNFNFTSSAEAKAVVGGVAGSFFGALIGLAVGSAKIKVPINGNQKSFTRQKENLKKFKTF